MSNMEDLLKFLMIAGVIAVGIFNEVKKNNKAKEKAKQKRPAPAMPPPVELAPDATPIPETWGRPKPMDEFLKPIPVEPTPERNRYKPASATQQKQKKKQKKKEDGSVAAAIANSLAQDERNMPQGTPYNNSSQDSSEKKGDFEIRSVEEARRAIIWGEILQRKY